MSKRRPKTRAPRTPALSTQYVEEWAGENWIVKPIRGSSSTKNYRCPGCDQEIRPATPHLVIWPEEPIVGTGLEARRHWHSTCWNARNRRGPR
jgi:hypothetical protein